MSIPVPVKPTKFLASFALISHTLILRLMGSRSSTVDSFAVDNYLSNGFFVLPDGRTGLRTILSLKESIQEKFGQWIFGRLPLDDLGETRIPLKGYRTSLLHPSFNLKVLQIIVNTGISKFIASLANRFDLLPSLNYYDIWIDGLKPETFDKPTETRLFHRDGMIGNAKKMCKIFVLFDPIDLDRGPFQIVKSSHYSLSNEHNKLEEIEDRLRGRYSEASVQELYGESSLLVHDGRHGLVAAADTHECLHRGLMQSPGKVRVMIALYFTFK